MRKIKTFIVKPLSSKKENISLLVSFILIILLSFAILRFRYQPEYKQVIDEHEISSYSSLNSIELGIYSDLKNSLFDISLMFEEKKELPSIEALISEEIPPYVNDATWKQRGSIDWIYMEHDNFVFYLGVSNDVKKIGTFLVKLNKKKIENSDIYFTRKKFPVENLEEDFGKYIGLFKKIVPYTGQEERKKFKGE